MATKYMSVTGGGSHDGSSEANAYTFGEFLAAAKTAGDIFYAKAGTYPTGGGTNLITDSGTDTALLQLIGYNTTPGDLDDLDIVNDSPAMPYFPYTVGVFGVSGSHWLIKRLHINGANTTAGGQFRCSNSTNVRIERCRIICTAANANSSAIGTVSQARTRIKGCYLQATSSAPVINFTSGTQSNGTIKDNIIVGGSTAISISSAAFAIKGNLIKSPATYGVLSGVAVNNVDISANTFYGCTDCVRLTGVTSLYGDIRNNIFANYTGYGVFLSTNTSLYDMGGNAFWAPSGTGEVSGIATGSRSGDVTLASDPFVDAAGGNFATLNGHAVRTAGLPGKFENTALEAIVTSGAVQGGISTPNLTEADLQGIHDVLIAGGSGDRISVDTDDKVVLGADQSHLTGLTATPDGPVDVGTILGEVPTLNADGVLKVAIAYEQDEPYTPYNAIASGSGQTTSHVVFSSYPAGNQAGRQILVTSGTGAGQWAILDDQTAAGQWDLKTGYTLTTPLDATSRVKFLGLGNTVAEIQDGIPLKGVELRYTNTASSELADVIITDAP